MTPHDEDRPTGTDAREAVDDLEAKVAEEVEQDRSEATPGDDLRTVVPGSEEPPD